MLHISSRNNPLYKQLRRLLQARSGRHDDRAADSTGNATSSKASDQADQYKVAADAAVPVILEGVHLCEEWLRHSGQPERAFFDANRLQSSKELQGLVRQLDPKRATSMDAALMGALSPIAKGQGVVFLVHHVPVAMPQRIDHACIWLDRIQDPGNVGTLLRTAVAAGIEHAYLSEECASAWSPRVLRSAQGAHFAMTIYEHVDVQSALQRLQVPICTTALTSDAMSLYDVKIPTPCAWVFGNEGQGVKRELVDAADYCVYIPQEPAVESLNVAVAAGICLFEHRRQQLQLP